MPDFPKSFGGRSTHFVSRRVISLEIREPFFDFGIPALEGIVVCIRAHRRVFLEIRLGGVIQHLSQANQFGLGFLTAE